MAFKFGWFLRWLAFKMVGFSFFSALHASFSILL